MFCTNCGKEIPNNMKFCVSCGMRVGEDSAFEIIQKKKTSKKNLLINVLIAGSIASACLLPFIFFYAAKMSATIGKEAIIENVTDSEHITTEETESVETVTESVEERVSDKMDKLDRDSDDAEAVSTDFDIEEEVLVIREKYNTVVYNMKNYTEQKPQDGITIYLDANGNAVFIKVARGYNGIDYERWYLVEQGELLFSFVFSGTDEHRLYFKQGILFRYIDNKVKYDNVSGILNCKWEQTSMEESADVLRLITEY